MSAEPEPDQIATRWDNHIRVYEEVFEPFTLALTEPLLERMALTEGARVIDVAAGPGAAALALARRGCRVTAIDAAQAMVARTSARAAEAGLGVEAAVMDAAHLAYPDAHFDAAYSAFGIVLLADAAAALAEMRRVVRPGGRVGITTWTAPERYELAKTLAQAIDSVWPDRPRPPLPAQLRFREEARFEELFVQAGLPQPDVWAVEAILAAPSARWLVARLGFAPGMAAMLDTLGPRRAAAIDACTALLEEQFGEGPVALTGVAFSGICVVA